MKEIYLVVNFIKSKTLTFYKASAKFRYRHPLDLKIGMEVVLLISSQYICCRRQHFL